MIMQTVQAAKDSGIMVSLCGEMAGDPFCTSLLLGIGIDELSTNAGVVPMIKKLIRSLSREEAIKNLQDIMKLTTSREVREFIANKTETLTPEFHENGLYRNLSLKNA
jgi:phosphotransferase system enzyme I (PtsI)